VGGRLASKSSSVVELAANRRQQYHREDVNHCSTERRAGVLNLIGIAAYMLVLLASPFEHHDFVCHFKTPQHCMSCSANLVGSDPDAQESVATRQLDDLGSAVPFLSLPESRLIAVRLPARSPPASLTAFPL
jgi:hypothetical protein